MSQDLEVLANRANQALKSQPGFIECWVQSSSDRVLAYSFADDLSANQFQQQRALLNIPAVIHNHAPTVVLVTHS